MAETITTTTEEKVLPGKFQQYFQTFLNTLKGEAGFKDRSAAELKYDVTNALRPAYEKARANRIAQTGRNAAMVDTDAAARGMGSSTWVTDAKNRLRNQEAADLANLESDYAGNLYNALLNQLDNQDNKRMSLLNTALSTTQGMYDKWLSEDTAATSGSSGSSRKRSPSPNPDPDPIEPDPDPIEDDFGKEYTATPYTWSYSDQAKSHQKSIAQSIIDAYKKKNQNKTSQGGK